MKCSKFLEFSADWAKHDRYSNVKHGEIEPNLIPMKHWFSVHPFFKIWWMTHNSLDITRHVTPDDHKYDAIPRPSLHSGSPFLLITGRQSPYYWHCRPAALLCTDKQLLVQADTADQGIPVNRASFYCRAVMLIAWLLLACELMKWKIECNANYDTFFPNPES